MTPLVKFFRNASFSLFVIGWEEAAGTFDNTVARSSWQHSKTATPSLIGSRLPKYYTNTTGRTKASFLWNANVGCDTGAICVGPLHDYYPIGHEPGVIFTSRFEVPELPHSHNRENTTYYDYFNIFWRQQPKGGYFNQFVPQLMLGNVLANSSNYPDYEPQWLQLDQWHIGAQYFMGLTCNATSGTTNDSNGNEDGSNSNEPSWTAKAATGKLIQVLPGEVIETTFELVQISDERDWEWHLTIGVVGEGPSRWSSVVSRQPFMGLLPGTGWQDDIYQNVTIGSCLENYGMESAANFPAKWNIAMKVDVADANKSKRSFCWDVWATGGGPKCSWMPHSKLVSMEDSTWQEATWTATTHKSERIRADQAQ